MDHLGAIISHNLNGYKDKIPRVAENAENTRYINNFSTRAGTSNKIKSKTFFQEADMNLRKCKSNFK